MLSSMAAAQLERSAPIALLRIMTRTGIIMSQQDELIKIQCIDCGRPTSHIIIAEQHQKGWDEAKEFGWSYSYQIIQCRGCEAMSFRVVGSDSEDPEGSETLYPNRTRGRLPIAGYEYFPGKTLRIYQEVLRALNHRAPILAAIGLRALVESICIDQ